MKRIGSGFMLILLLVGILGLSLNEKRIIAYEFKENTTNISAVVRVIPETVEVGPENVTGQEFTIAVVLENVTDLGGFDIQFGWNTTYLHYVDHITTAPVEDYYDPVPPSPYGGILHWPVIWLKDEVNTTAGTYWAAFFTLGGLGFNGSGTSFIMTFNVAKQPQPGEEDVIFNLHFTNHDLADTSFPSMPIPHEVFDGTVVIHAFEVHDIAIDNITTSATVVELNNFVFINVTIENQGDYTEIFNVTTYANTTIVATVANIALANGTSTYITFTWNTTGFSVGNYTIKAVADPVPGETDLEDNTLIDGIVAVLVFTHDIAILNVEPSKTVVGVSYSMNITVAVENQGDTVETFNLTVHVNETEIEAKQTTLTSGSSAVVTFTWDITGFMKGNYTISAYAEPVLGETDLSDNNSTDGWVFVTIQGDVDGDRDVDIYDVVKITGIYGSKRGDPQFNPNSDLDDDGEIKIYDVVRCTSHYGQSWQP